MLDTLIDRAADAPAARVRPTPVRADAHPAQLAQCLTRMLDEIDYGMLLVGSGAQVLYSNHAARLELDGDHPLQLLGNSLHALRPHDVLPLQDALAAAQRGLRRLVTLGAGVHRVGVSVVPLPENASERAGGQGPLTLLVLGKRQVCEQLSVHGFARSLQLTPAETRVLELLCAGARPTAIARQQNVAVSTVRTQIGSIRAKTGAGSISELVRQVAVLPPLVGALRGSGWPVGGTAGLGVAGAR